MDDMGQWLFQDELELAEINVPRAALQFAKAIGYPNLQVVDYMSRLHEIGEEAEEYVAQSGELRRQAEILSAFLFRDIGFQGNTADYNDPRNSFLNEVLDRKFGNPISLSVIYIDIANRLNIPAFGIGLPGHFIVGIRNDDDDEGNSLWLDPFHGGQWLDLMDCAQLINLSSGYEGPLDANWFKPASERRILARMLSNLRASYVITSQWEKAATVIQLVRQVQPNEPQHLRDLGLVFYHQGRLPKAAHYLNAYLQQTPEASDAQLIRDGMRDLLDGWVPMN